MAHPEPAIEAVALRRAFGQTHALDGIDLVVPAGSIYGVLGPNGAGKTTLVRVLATLLRPDEGSARVLGHDVIAHPDAIRREIALTGQFASVDDDLTGAENLALLARLRGFGARTARRRAADLLEVFELGESAHRQVKTYSGGMRRRLDIAASLITTPRLLFLDEPTTGLDPVSRRQVWEIVTQVVHRGTTVLLTTQYLDEADQLADRVAVVDQGRVIAEGTTGELKASVGAGVLRIRTTDARQRAHAVEALAGELAAHVELDGDPVALTVRLHDDTDPAVRAGRAAQMVGALSAAGVAVTTFSLGQPSLDEVFLALTGRTTHPASTLEGATA